MTRYGAGSTYGNTWAETGASPEARAKIQQFMAGNSVFIENAGQWQDTSIKFALDSRGANVGLTDHGPRFQLFQTKPGLTPADLSDPSDPSDRSDPSDQTAPPPPSEMHEFALVFDGAAAVTPVGRGQSDRKFNYLVGDAANHREGVGSFNAVWYENLYPGISLEMTGRRSGVKYNFHIAPGADWRTIRLRYEDIDGLTLKENGALEINIADGWPPLSDGTPYIYQEVNGEKQTIAGQFTLLDEQTYGFEVTGDYDPTLPLVIDPEVYWSTYLGGTDIDYGNSVAVDGNGACYVTGYTSSSGWVSGGWDTTLNNGISASEDGYVAKFDSAGVHQWSTYLGGTGDDEGDGIAVDDSGACYVTGLTMSSGWISGGWHTIHNGGYYDGYVVKLDSGGGHIWSTYLGGTSYDKGFGIAVDASGNCYATGGSTSTDWTSGGWDTSQNGEQDGYVVKFSSNGEYQWSSYLGGTGEDRGKDITVDDSGACYITGYTYSSDWTSGGWDTSLDGDKEGYVVKLNSMGQHEWSTYLGGTNKDDGWGIAVDTSGNCYATGITQSSGWVSGGWDTTHGGTSSDDGYVVKLNNMGQHEWSTYLGGTDKDQGRGITVDGSGACYVTGATQSSDWVSGGWDTTRSGTDAYVVQLNSAGTHQWSTYAGGTSTDYGQDIAVDGAGANIWVVGFTWGDTWVMPHGWQTIFGGEIDAFLLKAAGMETFGNLQVTLTPAEVVVAGAQWRRVSTSTWMNSGDTEMGVPAGYCDIEFKEVPGWAQPLKHTVWVPADLTTTDTGIYTVITTEVSWSTYLGGTNIDKGQGIAVDDTGACYVTGTTKTSGWVSGGWDTTHNGNEDAYVVKLNSAGAHLWSTYLGGGGNDYGYGIALDWNGDCYVSGSTFSSDWVSSGWDTTFSTSDGYVVKLNTAGGHIWSTYIGGTDAETGFGIAVDAAGDCYVTGYTYSSGWVSGGWDTSHGGTSYSDGYVVKLNSTGQHVWSTYLGSIYSDEGYGIAVTGNGACFVAGSTESSGWVSGGWNTTLAGNMDGYVAMLNAFTGSHTWSSYLGGTEYDEAWGVAADATGACFVTGNTASVGWTMYGWDVTHSGAVYDADGFVVKLNHAGEHEWSTYLGDAGDDFGLGIAVDSGGSCYATGYTDSDDWTLGGWDMSLNGGKDGYVVKFDGSGGHQWSAFLGGVNDDYGAGIAVDTTGANIWVSGDTKSTGWVFNGWHTAYSGNGDAFVAKIVDISIEGEGEPVIEGEGEVPVEGEGEIPAEGEGEGEEKTLLLPGNVPLELVHIPAGSFQMGSPDTERSRDSDEGPAHPVTINYDFYMGKYEVTQAQWLAVMGSSPEGYTWDYGQGDNYPAYYVSWDDAQAFITGLNSYIADTGQGPATVRLPSEAEWEYACRAGTQTRFYFGDSLSVDDYCEDDGVRSQYMWYCGNNPASGEPGYGSKPVGGKLPNAFGLHDMSGNVWEWCQDWYHSSYTGAPVDGSAWESPTGPARVTRGGYWSHHARRCRSAFRYRHVPDYRDYIFGFRLAVVEWMPLEGEGEAPVEGEFPAEGEGESVVEGEGEGEMPAEGEGEVPDEGEGEVPAEGEGETPIEGEVEAKTILLPGDVPLELVRIPAGSFQMGSPDSELSRYSNEGPVHPVTINYDFYMGKYEVTQAQWLAVMGSSPEGYTWDYGQGDSYPAYYVSWDDAQAFITGLNSHIADTGQGPATVRLPSEAEWEYAYRAGSTTRFYFGDSLSVGDNCEDDGVRSQYMWYCGNNSPKGTKPVGGKLPNAFGLHDMSGNLWEWCEDDWYNSYTGAPSNGSAWLDSPRGSDRVRRGGRSDSYALYCRAAVRSYFGPDHRDNGIGFRLAVVEWMPVEGEGEAPVEGEFPAEGEGESVVEGEGEGEPPIEGEGEVPAEGEGEGEVDLVTLTLTVQGSGTTMPTAGEHVYEPGSSVYVYAAPETGWFFDRWEGDLEGIVNPFSQGIIFMMDGDRTLTAVFLPGDWLLEIAATEGGTTSPSPGVHAYLDESVVWLFADPDPGYAFDFWEGDLASTSQFDSITMDADKSVTAWFAPADWTLSVLHAGSGSGLTFPPDGAVEGFLDGRRTGIVLQGVNPGSYWGGWSGDAAGYESLAVVTMDQDRTVVANFSDSGYDLFIDSVGEGVTNLPPGTHALAEDATPVLTATPDMGWLFEEWQGDIGDGDPSSSTLNLLMDRDRSITAVFVESDIEGEGETPAEGETSIPHPADLNLDYRMVIQEAIAYLAGWQQGVNPLAYAIRAAYLWQNGEQYHYDAAQDPPLCWVLGPAAEEGEVPLEGEVPEGEGEVLPEGEGELPGEGEPVVVPGELVDVPAGTL